MSKAVGSRSEKQCRGHHRKMIGAYSTIDSIVEYLSGSKSKMPCEQDIDDEE